VDWLLEAKNIEVDPKALELPKPFELAIYLIF
jgi:hypothetical protein